MSKELKFHPLADLFPLMEGAELEELVADIKANGLHEPVVLLDGKILDGRNRYRACGAAGVACRVFEHKAECRHMADPAAYVISANIHRRHLTAEQKREVIAKLLKAQPEKSNRQIAKTAKADHKTVASVRKEEEGRGEIPHVEERTDTKGRQQPVKKKQPEMPTKAEAHTSEQKDIYEQACILWELMDDETRQKFEEASEKASEKEELEDWNACLDAEIEDALVAPPEEIRKNILDSIDRHAAVARAYKKVLKVSSLNQVMKNEVSNAIGALITTWQSVQRALLRHREQKQGGNGVDPKQSADSRREEFAADE